MADKITLDSQRQPHTAGNRSKENTPARCKPDKPEGYPLFPHACGRWAKKIDGRTVYFGPWDDPAGSLEQYHQHVGQPQAGKTIDDICQLFLAAKEAREKRGDLSHVTFLEYLRSCKALVGHFGRDRLAETLTPLDFAAYQTDIATRRNIVATGNEVIRVRSIFKWANDTRLIEKANFGPDFRRASAKAQRKHRRERGKKLFTADEIQRILDESGVHLRAMILLGINCGLGNSDCANLPRSAVDLDKHWLIYPRPKTEVDRESPLWPETVEALRSSTARCPHKKRTEFFLMWDGKRWDNPSNPIAKHFRQAADRAGVTLGGFYWLRHTFATIGGDAKDPVAVSAMMGHCDSTMAGVYRERIDPQRLKDVSEYVRRWLFAGNPV